MGMPISLALRGRHTHDHAALEAWAEVMADLREVDRVFSTYRAGSIVSRLGRGELELVDCPPEVAEVLALGEQARVESGGAFDVRRGGRLDPSGVVKGWAVERAARPLRHLPGTDFCLSAGGDMVAHVAPLDAAAWQIGIEDPGWSDRPLAVVALRDGALATSSTAVRTWTGPDGTRVHHLIDPHSWRPANSGLQAVTVAHRDPAWAEIWSKALFIGGAGRIGPEARARGMAAWWVEDDGSFHLTPAAAAMTPWRS